MIVCVCGCVGVGAGQRPVRAAAVFCALRLSVVGRICHLRSARRAPCRQKIQGVRVHLLVARFSFHCALACCQSFTATATATETERVRWLAGRPATRPPRGRGRAASSSTGDDGWIVSPNRECVRACVRACVCGWAAPPIFRRSSLQPIQRTQPPVIP